MSAKPAMAARAAEEWIMKRLVPAALALLLLSACASNPKMDDAQRLALYRAHAAAPVDSFQYFGRIDGWTPLGDSALAVWTKPNQAYLLELQGRCPDLDFASAISVSNQMGRVHSRFDKVTVLGRQSIKMPCFIGRILPLDVKAIKQAQRDMREAGTMPEDPKP
ncbi:hypothetical protein GLA29479_4230 [Lysobacter antibioticus]|uniref:Lipoprotein n=2 Tax=Lysobacteraceae TaxID=32033 RepID=A0A0S2F8P3_LYSAN|nr:hypothetical protein GLA29479_4230 [Lysobacter antibioticus]ALN79925.1 hypothetical protein LA76x_1772 [Lysobacter antibioticus]